MIDLKDAGTTGRNYGSSTATPETGTATVVRCSGIHRANHPGRIAAVRSLPVSPGVDVGQEARVTCTLCECRIPLRGIFRRSAVQFSRFAGTGVGILPLRDLAPGPLFCCASTFSSGVIRVKTQRGHRFVTDR